MEVVPFSAAWLPCGQETLWKLHSHQVAQASTGLSGPEKVLSATRAVHLPVQTVQFLGLLTRESLYFFSHAPIQPTYRPHAPMPGFGFETGMYQPTPRPPSFGTGSLPRNIPIQVVKHEVTRSPTPRRAAQSPEADGSSCRTPPSEAALVGHSKQSGSMSGDVIRNRHTLNVAGRRQQPSDKEATQYLHHSEEPQTIKVFHGSDVSEQVGSDAATGGDAERERDNNSIKPSQEDDNERCSSLKTVPSFEPIPLPYYSLPTQLPTVSVDKLKQSTKDPTEAPTSSAADKPQPPPVTSYDLISKALDELELLKPETVPSFEPIPLPYYSLPTQLPTVSVDKLKQSTKDPTEAPTSSAADKPQPPPVTSYDLISKALDELELLKPEVDAFASPEKDKQYIYLEDRLDKLVSKIDQIEADGDEDVRNKRREAIKQVLGTITLLEQKLATAKSSSNSCKSDTQAEPDSTTLSDPETSIVPTTTEPSV
ncbi:BAG domain protein [Opisthorchis viverrini]|uniref:BAG domain protein n=1 Tax=Opisthorchis viverrini TaxID=6198 RepID=A0A1S8WQJ8_OPIVI|nr:BAG domain protein [Opisthorchis viverrini]